MEKIYTCPPLRARDFSLLRVNPYRGFYFNEEVQGTIKTSLLECKISINESPAEVLEKAQAEGKQIILHITGRDKMTFSEALSGIETLGKYLSENKNNAICSLAAVRIDGAFAEKGVICRSKKDFEKLLGCARTEIPAAFPIIIPRESLAKDATRFGIGAYDGFFTDEKTEPHGGIGFNLAALPAGYEPLKRKGFISGEKIIAKCAAEQISALSLSVNFKEENSARNIDRWRGEYVSAEEITKMGVHFAPGYFTAESTDETVRSIFDFIGDHLGYLISITKAVHGENGIFNLTLKNSGFSPAVNLDRLSLVTKGGDEIPCPEWKPEELPGGAEKSFKFTLPPNAEISAVKLCRSLSPNISARFANQMPFENSANILI